MTYNYVLINHTCREIKIVGFSTVWVYIVKLINESDWLESDHVEMVYEGDKIEYIKNLIKEGYIHDSMY